VCECLGARERAHSHDNRYLLVCNGRLSWQKLCCMRCICCKDAHGAAGRVRLCNADATGIAGAAIIASALSRGLFRRRLVSAGRSLQASPAWLRRIATTFVESEQGVARTKAKSLQRRAVVASRVGALPCNDFPMGNDRAPTLAPLAQPG
jgi:hypothetical protein